MHYEITRDPVATTNFEIQIRDTVALLFILFLLKEAETFYRMLTDFSLLKK